MICNYCELILWENIAKIMNYNVNTHYIHIIVHYFCYTLDIINHASSKFLNVGISKSIMRKVLSFDNFIKLMALILSFGLFP